MTLVANISAAMTRIGQAIAGPSIPKPVYKGNSGTTTQTFAVATARVQYVTVTGAHTWAFTWPALHSEILIVATNAGAFALTLPTVYWHVGNGQVSTDFASMGVIPQPSGINCFHFWSPDGGTTIFGRAW